MPVQAPPKQRQRDVVNTFNRVVLRTDSSEVPQGGLVGAFDVDLYETPGVILSRRGTLQQHGISAAVRKMIVGQQSLISAEDLNVRKDGSIISSGLSATTRVDMVAFRGQRADIEEVFIANGADRMFRFGMSFGTWGIAGPAAAPVIAVVGGVLTGDYSAVYTYARKSGGVLIHESNPSPATATTSLTSQTFNLTTVASTNADVTHIRIYRTVAGGTIHLFEEEILNVATTVTLSVVDGSLGAAVDTDNDQPEPATLAHVLRDRIFTNDIARANRLRWTKRFSPESQPANNFIDIGPDTTAITGLESINGVLVVYTETSKFRVIEQDSTIVAIGTQQIPFLGGSTAEFVALELPSSRGTEAPESVVSTGFGIIYTTKEGVFVTNGTPENEQLLSSEIQPLFIGSKAGDVPAIDWANEGNIASAFHRGRYYMSYTSTESSDGENDITAIFNINSQSWYFWNRGYNSFLFNDEDNLFFGGQNTVGIMRLEESGVTSDFPTQTAIAASVVFPDRDAGSVHTKSIFQRFMVDAEVSSSDTLTANFYVDDVLISSKAVSGTRARTFFRLPTSTRGFLWRVELAFSGTNQMKVYGLETQFFELIST